MERDRRVAARNSDRRRPRPKAAWQTGEPLQWLYSLAHSLHTIKPHGQQMICVSRECGGMTSMPSAPAAQGEGRFMTVFIIMPLHGIGGDIGRV